MGAKNVAAAYAQYSTHPDLSDVAFRVLVYMALIALDDDRPPRFWGGRESLVHATGRSVPEAPHRDDRSAAAESGRRARAAAFQSVKRALQALVDAGAITRAKSGRSGSNAEYHLHLMPAAVVDVDAEDPSAAIGQGYATRTPDRYAPRTTRGTPDVPTGVRPTTRQGYAPRTPEEKRGTEKEQGGRDPALPAAHQAARSQTASTSRRAAS